MPGRPRGILSGMTRIEVTPAALEATAEHLRDTNVDTRRARRALADAGPAVTGSPELSAALSEHAEAWGWCLDRLRERVQAASRALATGAQAYDRVEEAVATASTPPH